MCSAKRPVMPSFAASPRIVAVGIAQRDAVLVVPGDVERLAVAFEAERPAAFARHHAKALARVELVDPVERRQLQAGLAGIGVELQRAGADHRVIGDQLGGFEIALDARVLHELHVAEIREALAADRVARRVDADLDVDAGQIADRVGVLGAGQPPDRDASRIAGVLGLVGLQRVADPRRRRRALGVGRAARRPRAAASCRSRASRRPSPTPASARRSRTALTSFSMLRPASGFFGAVALEAVLLKGRGGDCRRSRGGGLARRVGRAQRRHRHRRARDTTAGAWADSSDASATVPATHNPERVMELPGQVVETGQPF